MERLSAFGILSDELPQASGTVQPFEYTVTWSSEYLRLKHFRKPAPQNTSTALLSQSPHEILLSHCLQRKADAIRVAVGVSAKLQRSLSHKVILHSSRRLSLQGLSKRDAHFFLYCILSLRVGASITAAHLWCWPGQYVLYLVFTSHSDQETSLSQRRQSCPGCCCCAKPAK